MEAKELMIGDWVKFNNSDLVHQIKAIAGKSVKVDKVYWYSASKLSPISLTTDVLEKNGFSKNYREDDLSYAQSCGDVIGIHIFGKGGIMDEMYFKYVHELQHALRLCGIEKEIEL